MLSFLANYKYILLAIGVTIEGPMLMIATGFLIHLKVFNFFWAFLAVIAGDLIGDTFWYLIGFYFIEPFLKKFGKIFKFTPEKFEKAKLLFTKYQAKILIISKSTLGFGMALVTLMAAGASRVPFKKYILLNLAGEIILVSILFSLGAFLGRIYFILNGPLKIYFVLTMVLTIILIIYFITKYLKKRLA